ncbi:F-box only protein 6 [Dufourea novaeangliae]|uniref:F-box only protein 6 n=1 Tax=Dufourea novaeangliae TaxID=178035 RepID=A0A154PGR1_DUFNO|nr:F-box only protein 6 [Dufourea novaeangliae]
MGQFHDSKMSTRIEFDEESDNGLVLADKYLPGELLTQIFIYVDYKSLLNCQLVCKRWEILIRSYVWRKKAELSLGRSLLLSKDVPWQVYYFICKKKPFERNLLKNNCGEHGIQTHWKILEDGGDRWTVENPPQGVPPLPSSEPIFEGKKSCFVTSYHQCLKAQEIDLEHEGLTPYVLDNLQPPIVVFEWYSCRWDCPAIYECGASLINQNDQILDSFQFHDRIDGEKQNQWHYISKEFSNYGPGLRKISFYHGGIDRLFWAGHYGSKMTGACVYIKIPTLQKYDDDENNMLSYMD